MLLRKALSSARTLGSVARSQRRSNPGLCLRVAKPVWQHKTSIFNSPLKASCTHYFHTSRSPRIASAISTVDPGAVHVAHTFLEQAVHVHWIQRLIGTIHSWGLPWFQAIAATTVMFRTIFLPLNIDLLRNSSRLNSIREELTKKEDALVNATSDEEKYKIATEIQDLFKEHKCSPYKNIITPLVMIPVFVSIFFAVEGLSYLHPEMTTGGTLWFTDLSKPDPSYFLPIVSAVTWLATVELGGDIPRTERMKWFRNALAYVSLALIPVTFPIPAGIFVYWISSNLFSIAQILTMRNTKLRRRLGFPLRQVAEKQKAQSNDKLGLTV